MRLSRHLLILTLLAAAVCSDRNAALAATPEQPRVTASQGLIHRLSAQLRAAIMPRTLLAEPCGSITATPLPTQLASIITPPIASWLLNLPPPALN